MTKLVALAPSASNARCLVPAPSESLKLGTFSSANEDAERRSHETLPGLIGEIARGLAPPVDDLVAETELAEEIPPELPVTAPLDPPSRPPVP